MAAPSTTANQTIVKTNEVNYRHCNVCENKVFDLVVTTTRGRAAPTHEKTAVNVGCGQKSDCKYV